MRGDIGNRELVDPEKSGLRVPPADPRALAEALLRLLADAGLRARLGRAVEGVLRSGEVLALKRRGDVRPLSAALSSVETAEGAERLRAHLAERPYPHFEVSPDQPGLLVKIDEDG